MKKSDIEGNISFLKNFTGEIKTSKYLNLLSLFLEKLQSTTDHLFIEQNSKGDID